MRHSQLNRAKFVLLKNPSSYYNFLYFSTQLSKHHPPVSIKECDARETLTNSTSNPPQQEINSSTETRHGVQSQVTGGQSKLTTPGRERTFHAVPHPKDASMITAVTAGEDDETGDTLLEKLRGSSKSAWKPKPSWAASKKKETEISSRAPSDCAECRASVGRGPPPMRRSYLNAHDRCKVARRSERGAEAKPCRALPEHATGVGQEDMEVDLRNLEIMKRLRFWVGDHF